MNGPFITALYVTVGIIGFAAVNHGVAYINKWASRAHLLFALMATALMCHSLSRASAYHAQTVSELVLMRRWEVTFICLFFVCFVWFIREYTGVRSRKFLIGISALWIILFAVNLILPYGVQFNGAPTLMHIDLPWGERLTDLRVIQSGIWHKLGWVGIGISLGYGLYASYVQYNAGNRNRERRLSIALCVFIVLVMLNVVINQADIKLPHVSDFGFLAFVIFMDIELTKESRDQNRRLNDLFSYFPIAVGIRDINGRYQFANSEFMQYFGIAANAVNGKTDFDLFPEDLASKFKKTESEVLKNCKSVAIEYIKVSEGKRHFVRLHEFPLQRSDGTIFGTCCIHNDLTDQKVKDAAIQKLRLQLWRADRVVSASAITSSIAHELCQPLNAILNNSQAGLRFLTATPVDLNEIRDLLQDIVRDDKRAGSIINSLRGLLQNQETPYTEIDINVCINEVLEILHGEFIRLNIKTEFMPEKTRPVFANKVQIQQVLINLIMNALESMAVMNNLQQSLLYIHTELIDAKSLRVSIRDNGTGIPEDKLEQVFDKFYTTKRNGLGIGLEVCRSIIEQHSGTIGVEANADTGVTFSFVLPLSNSVREDSSDQQNCLLAT